MAAGDIIIPGNTITPEILQQIAAAVEDLIASTAKDPGQYREATTLLNLYSLPSFEKSGSAWELVLAPISLLKGKDGKSAFDLWKEQPGNTDKTITDFFNSLKGEKGDPFVFDDFTTEQLEGLSLTFEKLTPEQIQMFWNKIPEDVVTLFQQPATDAATEVRQQMDGITQEATQLITTTTEAKDAAIQATEKAQSVSDHPGYIGEDYHVYTWDYATGAYNKTDTVLRPEGFSIFHTYPSIDAMNADKANVPEGKFVLINTGSVEDPDTARLYVKGPADFDYLVDMSGAIGFTGKTPQITIGTVTVGGQASATLSPDGTDDAGNPRFKLNLVIVAGPQGLMPVIELGTVSTGQPGTNASATFEQNGQTADGRDKYLLNLTIPQGMPGTGSGNVLVDASGIMAGKKYLFVPNADGSPVGAFVEYELPSVATAEKAGLMSPEQFQKLENLNPAFLRFLVEGLEKGRVGYESNATYLYNAARAKKVEYTDTGKLLFEGKEAFAVDADNELTLAGKKLSELGGGAVPIPYEIINLKNESTSDEIKAALGGDEGFERIYEGAKKGVCFLDMSVPTGGESTGGFICQAYQSVIGSGIKGFMIGVDLSIVGQGLFLCEIAKNGDTYQTNIETGVVEEVGYTGWVDRYFYDNSVIRLYSNRFSTGMTSEEINNALKYSDGIRRYIEAEKNEVEPSSPFDILYYYGCLYGVPILYRIILEGDRTVTCFPKITNYTLDGATNSHHKVELSAEYNGVLYILAIEEQSDGTLSCVKEERSLAVKIPAATHSDLGGIKTGYTQSDKNYPVQLDATNKAYVNVPWTDTDTTYSLATTLANGLLRQLNGSTTSFMRGDGTWATPPDTTYSPATQSANGLMSASDKKKLDRIGSYTRTTTTVANLNVNYETILVTLSANASLSVNLTGTAYDGGETHVFVLASGGDRTVTIPTTGSYISMCGSSVTIPSGKWCEFNLVCVNGIWHIARLEQE